MNNTTRRSRVMFYLATVLGGTVLPATCETRIHDAFVDGASNFAFAVLDPSNIDGFPFDSLFDDLSESDEAG